MQRGGAKVKLRFYLLGSSKANNPSAISQEQITQWQNQGLIEYLGECEDVRPYIESASCVVLPSYREGVSVSLLESMSMGKPIITSKATGCKDLVIESHNGFTCEVKSATSLAKCMQQFIDLSPEQRDQMGSNAREFVLKRYDVKRIIDTYHRALARAEKS